MPDETTTINTFKSDRNRLDELRRYPNELYRLSFAGCWTRADPELRSPGTLTGIQASLDDIQRGCDARGAETEPEKRGPHHNP